MNWLSTGEKYSLPLQKCQSTEIYDDDFLIKQAVKYFDEAFPVLGDAQHEELRRPYGATERV